MEVKSIFFQKYMIYIKNLFNFAFQKLIIQQNE
jgi:hypothetical protein